MPEQRLQRTRDAYESEHVDDRALLAWLDFIADLNGPITDEVQYVTGPDGTTHQVRIPRRFEPHV